MTMKQELIALLQKRWVTPLEALEQARCLSLSQRVGEMRRSGINVIDKWVELHNGKRIKAYRIPKAVK